MIEPRADAPQVIEPPTREAAQSPWPLLFLALIVFAAYFGHIALFWTQINDDAFITFRYSRFLALGQGPYFNVGEHVEGYTNFLLMLMMAGVIKLFGPDEVLFAAKLTGVLGGLLAIVSAAGLAASWLRSTPRASVAWPIGWIAGALVASNSAFALNSTTGLETALFAGWITLGLWLGDLARRSGAWRCAGIAFALAGLTRPEGPAVFAAAFLGRIVALEWRSRAGLLHLFIDGAVVTLVFAAQLAFRQVMYDGELVPNTYYAKLGGFQAETPGAYLWRFAWDHLAGAPLLIALLPLAAPPGVRARVFPTMLVAGSAIAFVLKTGPDWMLASRLLVPFFPAWAALAVAGLVLSIERIRRVFEASEAPVSVCGAGTRRLSRALPLVPAVIAPVALGVGLFVWQWPTTRAYYLHTSVRTSGYLNGHLLLADYLNQVSRPGETVALMDIGLVGYQCIELNVLDITGLTDRYIAKSPGAFLNKQFDAAYVFDRRPEYLVIVLTAPVALQQLSDLAQLSCWTGIEQTLIDHPLFVSRYVQFRPDDAGAAPLDRLAAALGAEKVFQHDYPGAPYLLVLYRARRTPRRCATRWRCSGRCGPAS